MRALFTVFVLLLDEIVLVGLALFVLWKLGVRLSPGVIIGLVVLLVVCVFVLYKIVSRVHKRKPLTGHEGMIGLEGKVVEDLAQDGLIQVCGELWKASATDAATIAAGEAVVVVRVEGLRIVVRRKSDA